VTFAASVAARRCCGRKGRGRHRTGIAVTFHRVPPLRARGDGRDVSSQYGGMDETCPVSTGGKGGGGRAARREAWAGVLLVGW
jgi:hypothetical protein